jgi:hypothetical protein
MFSIIQPLFLQKTTYLGLVLNFGHKELGI